MLVLQDHLDSSSSYYDAQPTDVPTCESGPKCWMNNTMIHEENHNVFPVYVFFISNLVELMIDNMSNNKFRYGAQLNCIC